MPPRGVLALLIILAGCVGCASDKPVTIKTQTFDYNGSERHYCVYTPAGYDPARRYPTVLFLHGLFESGNNGTGATKVGIGPAIRAKPDRFNCIVIFAQTSSSWRDDDQLPMAIATLDDASSKFAVDRGRVTATGLSTGGAAVWKLGARYPRPVRCPDAAVRVRRL